MSGKVEAFARYGVKLKNDRWSWSGISPAGDVVLGLWQDEFDFRSTPPSYRANAETIALWHDRPGNRERIEHLAHARKNTGGRFRVVVMRAKDITADPREVAEAFARENMNMELVEFDEDSGLFTARLVSP